MNNFNTEQTKTLEKLNIKLKKNRIKYDLDLIKKAYDFTNNTLGQEKRLSGESLIEHCVNVAGYLVELNLDTTSICAGLLHAIPEKTSITTDELDKEFGTEIAFIIDGLKDIRKIAKNIDNTEKDKMNFNNLIFNASEDIRIVMVRLADKLDNILTIEALDSEQGLYSAKKMLNVYAPLAEYLGLGSMQRVMQDKAFQIVHPNEYKTVSNHLEYLKTNSVEIVNNFNSEIKNLLSEYDLKNYEFYGRQKGKYSIYKKVKSKYLKNDEELNDLSFTELQDVYAFRLIFNNIEECYIALGLLHSNFEYNKDSFEDYISKPKENGYKSIHTVLNYQNNLIEVQIRTKEMHEYNEFGPASHIAYKLKSQKEHKKLKNDSLTWTKDLVGWKDKSKLSKEDFQVNVLKNSVFVFTPKGLVIMLDKGATPLDFAFRIHTNLGYSYQGATVNGKMVSRGHELKTGDVVEIIPTKNTSVTIDWLKDAKTSSARGRIRRKLRSYQK